MDKLDDLLKNLSDKERQVLIKQLGGTDKSAVKTYRHSFPKNHAKFGYFSDSHIGHKKFQEDSFYHMGCNAMQEGVDTIYCSGDILEGMSGREGHIYELDKIGFTAQIEYAEQLFKLFPKLDFHAITGNHDQWYANKNNGGVSVGKELEQRCKNFHFLGDNEADVMLSKNIKMKLFHANDGTAYATSYKLQKLVESFTGGDKPNIVLEGHYHKSMSAWIRNVFAVEAGTLCGQSWFMRGKKIPANMGYGIMDVWYDKSGLKRVDHSFYPEFERK